MPGGYNRLRPEDIKSDRAALTALRELDDYAPMNAAFSVAALTTLDQKLEQVRQHEIRVQNALTAAHDATVAAEWALHEAVRGAKRQALAQYGDDSDAIQSLGLKKRSKYLRGGGRTPKPDPSPPTQ